VAGAGIARTLAQLRSKLPEHASVGEHANPLVDRVVQDLERPPEALERTVGDAPRILRKNDRAPHIGPLGERAGGWVGPHVEVDVFGGQQFAGVREYLCPPDAFAAQLGLLPRPAPARDDRQLEQPARTVAEREDAPMRRVLDRWREE